MDARSRENRIKLHMLQSLAISERALARLLSQVADEQAGGVAASADLRGIERRLAAITRCQEALLYTVSGIRVRHVRRSSPGPIWFPGRGKAKRSTEASSGRCD